MKKRNTYNKHFDSDEHIKNMLQDFKAPFDPASWDQLSQKMDDAFPFIPVNDEEIKTELSNLNMPYNPDSWIVLAERMDLFDARKKWILRGKLAELTMFFFVFYLFTGSINHNLSPIQKKSDVALDNSLTSVSNLNADLLNTPNTNATSYSDQNNGSTDNLNTSVTGTIKKKRTLSPPKNESKEVHASNIPDEINSAHEAHPEFIINTQALTPQKHGPIGVTNEQTAHSELVLVIDRNDTANVSDTQLNRLPLLSHQIEHENKELNDLILPVLHPGNYTEKKISFLIGTVIGYDKDLIKSPFPHQKSEVMLGRIEDNFRVGLNMYMDMNAVEVSTGVHYLIKNYKSVYAGENQVRIAHIPVMLKLKLPFAGFMRGYVSGGVSGNYVVHANYQEHDYFRDRPQLDYIENNARAAGYSLLSSSSYRNGIFEGETIRGNHFYTANIAIGLEAHLNKIYSLFFEQAYSHHIKGSAIGPAFDHFFSSTSLLGIRYRILSNHHQSTSLKKSNTLR